jgi:hypothetical protein
MKLMKPGNSTLVVALALLLAGCGGSQFPIDAPGVVPQSSAITAHTADGGSWMLPEAKSDDLLYVDAGDGTVVYVFSYPKGKLLGEIKQHNSDMQQGLCADSHGDIFVNAMNGNNGNTYEYKHGGKKPIADLIEPYLWVYGCSVDPTSGNLAVASVNWISAASWVAVYQHASGTPQIYVDPAIINYEFCGYDNKGDLFVDGTGQSGHVEFAELPKGSGTFKNITLNQSIEWGGQVQWDGRHIVVGADDTAPAVAYQFAIKGRKGKEVGSTTLSNSVSVPQFWIQGSIIIGPDASANNVGLWKYPGGGAPMRTITGVHDPFGATVSLAKK